MVIKPISEETRRKLSVNNPRYWLGKKRSTETISKISEKTRGRHLNPGGEFKKGNKINLGRKRGKPWNYIDGRSRGLGTERYGPGWKIIRRAVYIRDNFTCQHCSSTGLRLEVHHKIPFMLTRDNSLENLISLCVRCHRKEETRIMKELKKQEEN